jgi:hypothetical protein
MTNIFQCDKSAISKQIRNVLKEGELSPDSIVAKFATVETEGNSSVSRTPGVKILDSDRFRELFNK